MLLGYAFGMANKPGKKTLELLSEQGITEEQYSQEIARYALENGCSRQAAWKAIRGKYLGESDSRENEGSHVKRKRRRSSSSDPLPKTPSVKISAFGGRTATMAEIVEFVAGHALVEDVTPDMCPDPRAYTYWWHCRNDYDFCRDFLKSTAVKLMPSKVAPEEGRGVGDYDGKVLADTIDSILAVKSAAEEIAG